MSDAPIFIKRREDKYQVRFWSKPEQYKAFVAECDKHGLVLQDVLNELMNWFTRTSDKGQIKIEEAP